VTIEKTRWFVGARGDTSSIGKRRGGTGVVTSAHHESI
jgi:hypothetical protein